MLLYKLLWNSGGIKKIHKKSVQERAYGTGGLQFMGRRFHVYYTLCFSKGNVKLILILWMSSKLTTVTSQIWSFQHCLQYRGKIKLFFFFVQVNKSINLCITYMCRKVAEGILFSSEWSKCWPMLWLEAKLDWRWLALLRLLQYYYIGMTAITLCIF